MKERDRQIRALKKLFSTKERKITKIEQLPMAMVPLLPLKVTFITQQLFTDVVQGLELVIGEVERLFGTYSEVSLSVIIGKWTSDFIEHFFGATRGRKGQHDAITLRDLFSTLKFQQHSG